MDGKFCVWFLKDMMFDKMFLMNGCFARGFNGCEILEDVFMIMKGSATGC